MSKTISKQNVTPISLIVTTVLLPPIVLWAHHGVAVLLGLVVLSGSLLLFRFKPLPALSKTPLILLGLLCLWGFISVFWAVEPDDTIKRSVKLLAITLLGCLGILSIRASSTPRDTKLSSLTIAILVALGSAGFLLLTEVISNGALLVFLKGQEAADKWQYVIHYTKNLTNFMALILWPAAFATWRLVRNRSLPLRSLGILLIALSIALILFIGTSKAALLAVLFGGSVAIITFFAKAKSRSICYAIVIAAIIAPPFIAGYLPSGQEVVENHPSAPSSIYHRLDIYKFSSEKIFEKPIFGWGLNSSRSIPGGKDKVRVFAPKTDVIGRHSYMVYEQLPLHPHNLSLQVWLELGAIGAIIITGLGLYCVNWISHSPCTLYRSVSYGLLISILVIGSTSYGAFATWWLSLQMLLVSILVAQAPTDVSQKSSQP